MVFVPCLSECFGGGGGEDSESPPPPPLDPRLQIKTLDRHYLKLAIAAFFVSQVPGAGEGLTPGAGVQKQTAFSQI